jgi:hypothetical protein
VQSSLRSSRLGFVLWGWMTLLVVLVSAAPDGGAPGSRELGSAFDPATLAVTVAPQPTREVVAAQFDDRRPPAPPVGSGIPAAMPVVLAALAHAATAPVPDFRPHSSGDPRALSRANAARAPPIA